MKVEKLAARPRRSAETGERPPVETPARATGTTPEPSADGTSARSADESSGHPTDGRAAHSVGAAHPVGADTGRDRRDSRWDEHRRARREQLVDATLAAIGRHGADVGMDEIAAEAGTSKTVLYRHFADRSELHLAVSARVADGLLPRLRHAVESSTRPRRMVAAAIETYLAFVEADPELYRFVVHGFPQGQPGNLGQSAKVNPIGSLSDVVSNQAAMIIANLLDQAGRSTDAADPWGHGLVGLVRSAADWWLRAEQPMPRSELAAHLTDLTWSGLSAIIPAAEERR